jgi:CRISPR/Cas system-associated endonuclease/helicase Cas3
MSKLRTPQHLVPVWRTTEGKPVSCYEKIKVLNQNFAELRQIAQDALEDAILMECSEVQVRQALHQLIDELHNPYTESATEDGCQGNSANS